MRRLCGPSWFAISVRRFIFFPSKPPENPQQALDLKRKEAEEKGFARRDSMEDMDLLLHNTTTPETLPGSGVSVANLPPSRDVTPFDRYKRSTIDFTSLVTPHGLTGVGLGAGFGVKEDKRLGFLRPRNTLQPRGADLNPKFDENGMFIDESLPNNELIKKRLEYMRSIQGTTMSSREHFLLVDLDFEKDSILFGASRDEFERNVKIMKNVILSYQKWERSDNFYYYATVFLRLLTLWIAMEILHQYTELQLLASNYAVFEEVMNEEIYSFAERRKKDFQEAFDALVTHPPDFTATVKAIRAEKARIVAAEAEKCRSLTVSVNESQNSETSATELIDATAKGLPEGLALPPLSTRPFSSGGKAIPVSEVYEAARSKHPMDTTNEKAATERETDLARNVEMRRLNEMQERSKGRWESLTGFFTKWFSDELHRPLAQEDISNFSYAASPTSVGSMRLVRRIILPKSEDFTQIVREAMLEYQNEKSSAVAECAL